MNDPTGERRYWHAAVTKYDREAFLADKDQLYAEAVVREPTRRILIGSGYAVLAASSAEEALRIAAQHVGKIELLLTDVVMPGGSGKDLAADLSRMSPRTKVLYMSGYASQAIRLRAVSGPGLNLIEKPFASDDLLQRVHAVLNNR